MHCRGRNRRARRGGGAATARMRDPRAGRPGARGAGACLALLLALGLSACSGARGAAPPSSSACPAPAYPAPDPARPRYRLAVDIPATGDVTGTVRVRFTPDLPTRRLVFRLGPTGRFRRRRVRASRPGPSRPPDRAWRPAARTRPRCRPARAQASRRPDDRVDVPFRLRVPGPVRDRLSRSGSALRLGSFFPVLAWSPCRLGYRPADAGFSRSPRPRRRPTSTSI